MKQEDTRQKILAKALELFSVHGYDAVSVGQIAAAVGIKAPSLYNHFPSKRAIFDAIVEATAAQYEADTDRIDIHVQNARQDIPVFTRITEDGLLEKVRQIFFYSLHNETISRFRRMMTLDGVEDTGCPLKVLRTDYAKRIPFFTGMHRFLPALIQLQEGQVKQVPVRHFPRIAGKSKYNLVNRLIGPFKDCFAYRWMRKRYINYQVAENNLNS